MTIAEYIAGRLAEEGVRFVFGVPGGASIPYMEAIRGAGMEFILTSNEAAAGIMADVTARLTGIPGVCHATTGPGATNISTGTGSAFLDRSPVIVFTTEVPDQMLNRTTQMNIDHQLLFKPITKATFRLNPENISGVMASALRISGEEYPGPVHIGLPSDIADAEARYEDLPAGRTESRYFREDQEKIVSLLQRSRRPLLALGLTAARLNIREKLLDFLNTYKIPVVITPMAKGLIPEDHPCYCGVLFHALSDYLEDIYESRDLVIGAGYDPVEFNYESWIPDLPLIHFDIRETELPLHKDSFLFTGKVSEWFGMLKNLDAGSLQPDHFVIKGIQDEMAAVFNGFSNHFGPVSALKVLQDELPPDALITADVGSHLHLLGQYWKTRGSGRLLMTNGWSGMGFGIPAAIAAQLNCPAATVACITGDGGFLMMAGEIITAKRYNLPIIIVVLSDGELNLIKLKQSWKNIQPYGTILYRGDLFGSDVFLGIKVLYADSDESMHGAVIEALSSGQPVIINAVIDPDDYKWLVVKR
jgi:acetolactate synthase I/II/III large subunit